MQQGDAEGGSALAVRREPAALPEQLLAAMDERVPDHAGPGNERDRQVVVVRDQSDSVEAADALVADLVHSHRADDSSSQGASPGHTLPLGWPPDGLGCRPSPLV